MTLPARILGRAATDCSECRLTLMDALIGASDKDKFEVNFRTGMSLQAISDLCEACEESASNAPGFRFALQNSDERSALLIWPCGLLRTTARDITAHRC